MCLFFKKETLMHPANIDGLQLKFSINALVLSLTSVAVSTPTHAQQSRDEIIVTATRRAETVQHVPLNISAITETQIELQGLDDKSALASFVPGINISDQGRDGSRIVIRGLNADPIETGFGQAEGGGTVATYIGEIPLYIDLRLNDLQRLEVLLGPQGTLYGAGTLSGALRYIPNKPNFDDNLFEIRTDIYGYSGTSSISHDVGVTFNAPISDSFALRGSLDYTADQGFIDYPYIVSHPGVSEPDPVDFENAGSNFRPLEGANAQDIFSGRIAARWAPTDRLDATLTYYVQNNKFGGRNASSLHTDTVPANEYEFAARVKEPAERENSLLALEVIADLGFAELTSATGIGETTGRGVRDQTDLLISLDYSYELFPTFTAFSHEDEKTDIFNQELRFVSNSNGRFNWIAGAFYNETQHALLSSEFTPGYIESFNIELPASGDLEYFSTSLTHLEETALFGELGFDITDAWNITLGTRFYDYRYETAGSAEFPVYDYLFGEDVIGEGPADFQPYTISEVEDTLTLAPNQSKNGQLFKINTSYEFSDSHMVYATFSQGFRVGASNGGQACTDDAFEDEGQSLCLFSAGQQFTDDPSDIVILDERGFDPDTTNNYELGMKTTWLDGALRVNGTIYFVDWDSPQVKTASINASTPITVNAKTARSKGFELDSSWRISNNFNLRGSLTYTKAQLSSDVPGLIQTITPPGFETTIEAGQDGDRLPGSPEMQVSAIGEYEIPLASGDNIMITAAYAWQDDVLSYSGGRAGSYTLPSYGRLNLTIGYNSDRWSLTGYAENLFNDFSETSASSTPLYNQTIEGANVRLFRTNILPPRAIGARLKYRFK